MRLKCSEVLALVVALLCSGASAADLVLEQTFYYDGNVHGDPAPPAIAVAEDGTVAVAVNPNISSGNTPQRRFLVLLYDKNGEPIGQMASQNSNMRAVTFGPDGRVYTG